MVLARWVPMPVSVGTSETPSLRAGAGRPASSAKVGSQSWNCEAVNWWCRPATWPGQRTSVGSRMPPSQVSRLMPSIGPNESKKVGL